jgi:TPR repeat protein
MGEEDDRIRLYSGFEQAAASGDAVAAYNCAVCLAYGVGVTGDGKLALWLREAADQVPHAQFWYGRVLAEGRGAPKGADGSHAQRKSVSSTLKSRSAR